MAVTNLNFTKDWNNAEDFPPVVSNSTQARYNIQLLHDETKNYINSVLVPALEALDATVKTLGKKVGGAVTVASTAPADTSGLWVDTANGNVIKFFNGSEWTTCAAVWK